jgi:hypothetical protein
MLVEGLEGKGVFVVLVVVVVVVAAAAVVVVEAQCVVHLGGEGQFVDPPGVEELGFRI